MVCDFLFLVTFGRQAMPYPHDELDKLLWTL